MNTAKKTTKKTYFSTVSAIIDFAESENVGLPEGVTYDGLKEFVAHEVELLEKKAEAAAERAAKQKSEGDALREKIYGLLTDEFQSISEITAKVGDPDVSPQMVTARLTQLYKLERVVREQQSVGGEGKTRKVSVYKLA